MPSGIIAETLDRFFTETAPLRPGDRLVVAFSGGPDSTALLWGLAALGRERGYGLLAAHFDHGLDEGSSRRCDAAARLAGRLEVPFVAERAVHTRGPGKDSRGMEDWARRQRYAFLRRQRHLHRAAWVVTAHHRDDQIETVALRLLHGSGLEGLGGMTALRDRIARPLLTLPRDDLLQAVHRSGLRPVVDPTNAETSRPRNLVRHHLLPRLQASSPGSGELLLDIAAASRTAAGVLAARLAADLRLERGGDGASINQTRLHRLPGALWPYALSLLHRSAGLPYPAPASAQAELRRQLDRGGRIGCDCGDQWRWQGDGGRLHLRRRETAPGRFTYTLKVPGELEIPELGLRVSVRREPTAPWMLEGRPRRAALDLPLAGGDDVIVRNRRPGDRIRPLGCRYSRRLKEVLIDRRVPRDERDRLPLLCLGGRIAWVPGVTVDDAFRLSPASRPWVVRIEPA
jgi:tRNA(Ile)-lysidine synthase